MCDHDLYFLYHYNLLYAVMIFIIIVIFIVYVIFVSNHRFESRIRKYEVSYVISLIILSTIMMLIKVIIYEGNDNDIRYYEK